ncbi:hypothetical protein [Phaeospirillum tilakii]|uniref:Uncharacterized protein n=1 Tax=Phaeospirillum tilakii TaxID=741673 RepID=A0ABW5CDA0_9PROT
MNAPPPSRTFSDRRRAARRRARLKRYALAGGLAATLLAAATVWLLIRADHGVPSAAGAEQFLDHMVAAAGGVAPPPSPGGPVFHVERKSNGQIVVTAERVPPGPCVSAGWKLVRRGMLSINGITPTRVSAARLADLCNQSDSATVVWIPRPPE